MRVTGAADPTVSVKETLKGKLPQKKLVRKQHTATAPMVTRSVLLPAMSKKSIIRITLQNVWRSVPLWAQLRDVPLSVKIPIREISSSFSADVPDVTVSVVQPVPPKYIHRVFIEICGAEVQKGNAPTERKMQRMFRSEEVSLLIKKCNDFGAGGVSVAIGELADGLQVNLDKVPKKYAGLDGTEIAISESQERMAVVVDPKDVEQFLEYATEENLKQSRLQSLPRAASGLRWRGKEIVNISRAFLDTNGAHQEADV